MKYKLLSLLSISSAALISACSESTDVTASKQVRQKQPDITRWYSEQQVKAGGIIYQAHCATCHMTDASGTTNWKTQDINGKYPPPPLNGSAHTWHHHLNGLRRTVRLGGKPVGGSMPSFANKLNKQEIDDVLAWVQSNWSDKIYAAWNIRNEQAKK